MNGHSYTYQLKALGYRAILLARWKRGNTNVKLMEEVRQSDDVLFRASTVFPFVLFPDSITIDRVKVTVTHRFFFATAKKTSLQVEDILNVEATVGPFFGSIKIWTPVFNDRTMEAGKPIEINFLSRHDALEAEAVLQGYIIARHKKIETSETGKKELLKRLRQLGKESV